MTKLCAPSEPFSSESPKVAEGARGDIYIRHQGSSFALTCKVQGFPVPEYRWVCREEGVSKERGGEGDGHGKEGWEGGGVSKKGGGGRGGCGREDKDIEGKGWETQGKRTG